MSESTLTPAQQAQQQNRDNEGQYQAKTHGAVDTDSDLLGLEKESTGESDTPSAQRARNEALSAHLAGQRADVERAQSVADRLAVHDALDQMRTAGIREITMVPNNSGLGAFHIDEVTDHTARRLPPYDMKYGRAEEIVGDDDNCVVMVNRLEALGWDKDFDGAVTLNVDDEVGDGHSREALRAERDALLYAALSPTSQNERSSHA